MNNMEVSKAILKFYISVFLEDCERYKAVPEEQMGLSEEEINDFHASLMTSLGKEEYELVCSRKGLKDGRMKKISELGDKGVVTQTICLAIWKLRKENSLPNLFGVERKEEYKEYTVYLPTKYVRTKNVLLIRGEFLFVSGVLNYPKESWATLQNFGPRSKTDLVNAMRLVGYTEFNIP